MWPLSLSRKDGASFRSISRQMVDGRERAGLENEVSEVSEPVNESPEHKDSKLSNVGRQVEYSGMYSMYVGDILPSFRRPFIRSLIHSSTPVPVLRRRVPAACYLPADGMGTKLWGIPSQPPINHHEVAALPTQQQCLSASNNSSSNGNGNGNSDNSSPPTLPPPPPR